MYGRNCSRLHRCPLLLVSVKAQEDRTWGAPRPSRTCRGSSFAFPVCWHVPFMVLGKRDAPRDSRLTYPRCSRSSIAAPLSVSLPLSSFISSFSGWFLQTFHRVFLWLSTSVPRRMDKAGEEAVLDACTPEEDRLGLPSQRPCLLEKLFVEVR